ncbi:hypothetical protein V5E38_14090 [Rossellomorea sp. GAMAL-10_SWC]
MKVLKFFLLLIVLVSAFFIIWFYYPQYQIHMIKKQTVRANTSVKQPNYIKYISSLDKKVITHVAIGDSVIRGVGVVDENENLVSIFSHKLGEDVQKQVEFHNDGISGIKLMLVGMIFSKSLIKQKQITIKHLNHSMS